MSSADSTLTLVSVETSRDVDVFTSDDCNVFAYW
jgi:hypothetical protein